MKRARGQSQRRGVRRRSVLLGALAFVAGAVWGAERWLRGRPRPTPQSAAFPPEAWPLIESLVDAVVPRFGTHPAASEIDLWPRLDRCIELSPAGAEFYRQHWPEFANAVHRRVRFQGDTADPESLAQALQAWHREYAAEDEPSLPASYFEGIRRNVLLAYYSSPEGWASAGYAGPVRRSHPVAGG